MSNVIVSYDETTHGTATACAQGLSISLSAFYQALKHSPHQIESIGSYRIPKAKGRGSNIYAFTDAEEMYNQYMDQKGTNTGDYVSEYDHTTHAMMSEYVEDPEVGLSKSQLYIILREEGQEPEFKYRPSGRGKGSSVYARSVLKEVIAKWRESKANEYPSTYDAAKYVTMKDILTMIPEEWECNSSVVSPMLKLAGIRVDHKYRAVGEGRSRPTGIYLRSAVASTLEALTKERKRHGVD